MEKWLIKHNAKLLDGYVHAYGLKVKMEVDKVTCKVANGD